MKDAEFNNILDLMMREVSIAIESFYTYVGIHNHLYSNKAIYKVLNQNPSFWNITLHALQNTFFITLGRIFDDDPKSHSIHKLINLCLAIPQLFSKESLAKRKMGDSEKPKWIDGYLSRAFEPSVSDLRIFKKKVSRLRRIYNSVYADIRDKVIAHTEFNDPIQISQLFSRTQVGEIKELLYGLHDLLTVLWELLNNGKKPELGVQTYDYESRISQTTQNALNIFQTRGGQRSLGQ